MQHVDYSKYIKTSTILNKFYHFPAKNKTVQQYKVALEWLYLNNQVKIES